MILNQSIKSINTNAIQFLLLFNYTCKSCELKKKTKPSNTIKNKFKKNSNRMQKNNIKKENK